MGSAPGAAGVRSRRRRGRGHGRPLTEPGRDEAAVREALRRSHDVLERLYNGVLLLSAEGTVEFANQAFCDQFALADSPAALAGLPAREMLERIRSAYRDPEAALSRIREILERGEPVIGEEVALRDGRACLRDFVPLEGRGTASARLWLHTDITERKRAEEALRDRVDLQDRLAKIAATVPGMIFSYRLRADGSAALEFCTPVIEALWGFRPDELREDFAPAFDRIHPDDRERSRENIARSARTMTPWRSTFRVLHPQKGELWLEGHSVPRAESDGSVLWHGFVQDVTERRKAEEALQESERRFRSLVTSAPVAMGLVTHAGEIAFLNDRFVQLFGYSSADLPTLEEWWRLAYPDEAYRREAREAWSVAVAESAGQDAVVAPREWRVRCKDGTVRDVQISSISMGDGGLASFVDLTARKRAENAVRELNGALEQRVRERTAELVAANRELEAFAYAVSHDLRGPLRAMNGLSQVVLEDFGADLPEEAVRHLNDIVLASRRMADLIDGLLRLSRSTRGELRRDTVDLSALSERLLGALAATEPRPGVSWTVSPALVAQGDVGMLEVVLANLLGNAWKYTATRAAATIEVGAATPATFFVRDNGAGFDMRHAGKLFQPFQRLHRQDEFPGLGIGLATVQRIVHRHGGRVWAEGEVDRGATFFVALPGGSA